MAPPIPPDPAASPAGRRVANADSDGLRLLRRFHEGTLQFHERRLEVKFVFDGATGEIVLPADPGFASELGGRDLVLHLPEESLCHLQLQIDARPIARPEAEEAVDRWSAYHAASGPAARGPRAWLRCRIEGGKVPNSPPPGEVYPADVLTVANALRTAEPRLVKFANADLAALARAARRLARLDVAAPLCVGVDPLGLDIRARFGIVRLEFDLVAVSQDQAEDCIKRLLV